MAVAPDPKEVLRSTDAKDNFQRLTRLLIGGGSSLLTLIFDNYCPPSQLPIILNDPTKKSQLKAAKLTKPQWDCLYPSPGVYGKSTDFDVTLLFRLLSTVCGLTPPSTGWDACPNSADHTLTADLVRIKYYRNSIYGHVKQNMEISNEAFLALWQDISVVLVRIAKSISNKEEEKWRKAINEFLTDPLTEKGDRNVQELERWYVNDMEVKESIKGLETEIASRVEMTVRETIREEAQEIKYDLGKKIESIITEKLRDEIGQLHTESTSAKQRFQVPDQDKDQCNRRRCKEIHQSRGKRMPSPSCSPVHGALLRMRIDCKTTEPSTPTQREATEIAKSSQAPQTLLKVTSRPSGACSSRTKTEVDTKNLATDENDEKTRRIPSARDVLNVIAASCFQLVGPSQAVEPENGYRTYLENVRKVDSQMRSFSIIITLECRTLEILDELWSYYSTGNMAQTLLVSEGVLKDFGLLTVTLDATIAEEEYRACRECLMRRSGKYTKEAKLNDTGSFRDAEGQVEREGVLEGISEGKQRETSTAEEENENENCSDDEDKIREPVVLEDVSEGGQRVTNKGKEPNEKERYEDEEEIEKVLEGVSEGFQGEKIKVEELCEEENYEDEEEIEEVLEGDSEGLHSENIKVKELCEKENYEDEEEIEEVLEGLLEGLQREKSKVEEPNEKEDYGDEEEIEEVLEGASEGLQREKSKMEELCEKEDYGDEEEIEEVLEGFSQRETGEGYIDKNEECDKEEIIEEAIDVFSEGGQRETSVDETIIAKEKADEVLKKGLHEVSEKEAKKVTEKEETAGEEEVKKGEGEEEEEEDDDDGNSDVENYEDYDDDDDDDDDDEGDGGDDEEYDDEDDDDEEDGSDVDDDESDDEEDDDDDDDDDDDGDDDEEQEEGRRGSLRVRIQTLTQPPSLTLQTM